MIDDALLDNVVAKMHQEIPNIQGIYLFGSQAFGETHHDSDIDLAILVDAKIEVTGLWDIAQTLAELAGHDVDLVDLRASSTVMRMQVIAQGRRISCRNTLACETFEDFIYSDYARLNEERAMILSDIAKRGLVYG